ncbi:MAG: DUF3486 family protein [Opitutaceae bacterium]|nr:DUF3486 family protein [Opitutaceae bacterium]
MKKPRADSKLKSLPPHQQEQLRRWLLEENVSYEDARERVHMDFGIRVSKGAIHNYYATCRSLEERDHAREFAEAICAKAGEDGADFDKATLRLVREKAFVLARLEGAESVNEFAILAKVLGDSEKIRMKQREVALAERRVALLEKKAAQADQTTGVLGNQTLTEEEKAARIRQIFRM